VSATLRRAAVSSYHVGKPTEYFTGTRIDTHVCEAREGRRESDRDPRKTRAVGPLEDLRGLTRESESIKYPRTGVQITASRGPGTSEQASIDQGGKSLDSSGLDRNDEWTGCGVVVLQIERRIVGRDEQADDGRTENVEEENTNVHSLDRFGNITPRVLRLTCSDGNNLCTDVGEGCLGQHTPLSEESTLAATNAVELNKGSWFLPITETNTIVIRTTAKIKNNTEDDEAGLRKKRSALRVECGYILRLTMVRT
jgi:hypothetical protein